MFRRPTGVSLPVFVTGGLSDLVDSLSFEMQIPELSNTPSSSRSIERASLIFLMLMSSIVLSIFSDAVCNQLGFYMSIVACLIFREAGVGVTFSD